MVATGTLMDADPRRIVAKRIILTGHPFKVHKRSATIRFMFFNPDDVWYYKSVELRTKLGRTGHIKESLGTHGYFKAQWDQQISMQDTIMMCLCKIFATNCSVLVCSLLKIHQTDPYYFFNN